MNMMGEISNQVKMEDDLSKTVGQQQQNGQNGGAVEKINNNANLIVNYLPQSLKEHDFNSLFSKIGPLKTCKLMFDRSTGYSFGYGFVEYMNEVDAQKAIETFNGYQLEHKRLKVALARPNCEDTKNTNLYIRNIPISYDEPQLSEIFSQFGEVVQVRLLRDQNTSFSRRIGFVIMATRPMAQMAIQQLDNTVPNGATEPIYVKYADEDGKKRHGPSHNNQHNRGNGGLNQQNQHQNNFQNNNNYLSQQQQGFGFNNPNSFMMGVGGNNQNQLNQLNSLQNLGKMKNNRSNGQNRYNPIGGTTGFDNLINTIGTGNGNNSLGNNGGYNHPNNFGQQQHHNNMGHQQGPQQLQQQQHFGNSNNFNNLNSAQAAAAAMAAAAAAGLGRSYN
jgi:RNA recognition motif-containing protein